jgi:hypothetical protein
MKNQTRAKLKAIIDAINTQTGSPLEPYSKDAEGRFLPNVGNFHIDYNSDYGYSILRFVASSEGQALAIEPIWTGRQTIQPAILAASCFLAGLTFQKGGN